MHTITVSHSQHAHSLRITVLNNCVKQVGREGISCFITLHTEAAWGELALLSGMGKV